MPQNYYPPTDETSAPDSNPPADDSAENEKAEGETFLIPKTAVKGDYKIGDTCTFRIVRAYENELEVEPVSEAEEEKAEGEPETAQEAANGLDEMSIPE